MTPAQAVRPLFYWLVAVYAFLFVLHVVARQPEQAWRAFLVVALSAGHLARERR